MDQTGAAPGVAGAGLPLPGPKTSRASSLILSLAGALGWFLPGLKAWSCAERGAEAASEAATRAARMGRRGGVKMGIEGLLGVCLRAIKIAKNRAWEGGRP